MTLENTLAPTLEQTFSIVLSSLANFFGVTTDIIMANAPQWLAKYGWYVTIKDLTFILFTGAIISGIVSVACLSFQVNIFDISGSKAWINTIIIFFILMVIIIIISILPCIVAPEITGLEALINLISN